MGAKPAAKYLYVHDWRQHQSYRADRGMPPWIKIQRSLLRSPKWLGLSEIERCHVISIWILAADNDGRVPNDASVIRRACGLDSEPDLNRLIELELLDAKPTTRRRQPDADMTPERRQLDRPEAEAEADTDTEEDSSSLEPSVSARARDTESDSSNDDETPSAEPDDDNPFEIPRQLSPKARLADLFRDQRESLWPSESSFPAPGLTLETQADEWLKQLAEHEIAEVVRESLAYMAREGYPAPNSFNTIRNSLQRRAAQKQANGSRSASSSSYRPPRPPGRVSWLPDGTQLEGDEALVWDYREDDFVIRMGWVSAEDQARILADLTERAKTEASG